MKKSLIALAVLAASGAAMAQSSVTLYGVADAGVVKLNGQSTQMGSSSTLNNGGSRLGVRGVEDLGGGLKAGFNFETGLSLEDGSTATAGAGFWGRAANMWVGGNWGTFKMGRTLTPSFYGAAAWELTGTANYSVVGNTFGYGGAGARNSSQFSYATPAGLGGFSAELGYIAKADNGGNAKWDGNLVYKNGPIAAGLSANQVRGDKANWALGGKYNFGTFAVAASYTARRAGVNREGFTIGGTANFGAFTVTADIARDRKNDAGKKYTNFLLEGKYALSKRTFVYVAGLRLDGGNNYGLGVRHNF
ncbi:porin [Ottowia caeni]|uniref:porin n=1 Tax=Ottowia caeni TaxID=2870339 RepID=UPI001E535518|nr:porin [Ottowia caeni]